MIYEADSQQLKGTAIDVCITAYDRRVYVQDESNWIVEFICSDGKWSEGKRLVEAAPGAGFSAVWWDQLGIANSEVREVPAQRREYHSKFTVLTTTYVA